MSNPADEPHDASHEPVGSVGEEATKLFGALADLARDRGGSAAAGWGPVAAQAGRAAQDALHDLDAHVATGSAECRWCPVCRVVHAVRETATPEVRAHLATAASSLLQAAAQLLEPPAPGPGSGERPARDVEHIDLDAGDDGYDDRDDDGPEGSRG